MNKNILIGRIGLSINFKPLLDGKSNPRFSEIVYLYVILALYNPEFKFYLSGPNDLHRLNDEQYNTLFPNHNVLSAWEREHFMGNHGNWDNNKILEYLNRNNVTVDFALIETCGSNKYCVPNFVPKDDGSKRKLLVVHTKYMAPYVYTLNKLGCPVYAISDDVRNILLNFCDLYNRERIVFTQMNNELETVPHIQSETDFTLKPDMIKCLYSHVERVTLIGLGDDWRNKIDIDRKLKSDNSTHFLVISNGYSTNKINSNHTVKDGRLPGYKEYVIDNFKNTVYENSKIYGKWSDEMYEKYPNNIDPTFPFTLLTDNINDARYSLVYSQLKNFMTIKPWEMILLGLIPFIHPNYDEDRLLGLPEYVYVKDAADLKAKIIELDSNNELYLKILNQCFDCIKKEDIDGSFINNFIFTNIGKDLNFNYEPKNNNNLKFIKIHHER
jgi:hypothetical protein